MGKPFEVQHSRSTSEAFREAEEMVHGHGQEVLDMVGVGPIFQLGQYVGVGGQLAFRYTPTS
jgi:hypothetical protein